MEGGYMANDEKLKHQMEKLMAGYRECISPVVNKMSAEEKGALKCMLWYGKNLQDEAEEIISSPEELKKFGEDVSGGWVSTQLNEIFTEGAGIMDAIKDIACNYGKQLDVTINKVLVKSLGVTKPMFSTDASTVT